MILVCQNGNNAAEGENNIMYASSYPMNWTVKNWLQYFRKGTDEWREYDETDEDNVPFELLEKVYVPDEDSLEQKINIFHGQLYSLYSQGER